MKSNCISLCIMLLACTSLLVPVSLAAQGPSGRTYGIGIIMGDPSGLSGKMWLSKNNSITASIGSSSFGSPRIDADYLWHFNAFNSSIITLYAGVGAALGFGGYRDGIYGGKDRWLVFDKNQRSLGIAARGVGGVNIVPRTIPLEVFIEIVPLFVVVPNFGFAPVYSANLGIRYYP